MSSADAEITRLARRVREEPRSTVFVALADALRRSGRLGDALQALREGLRVHPEHAAARVVLARIHVDMGNRAPAIDVLADVVRSDPENLAAASLLARLYAEAGRAADARPLVDRLRMAGHPDAQIAGVTPPAPVLPERTLRTEDPFEHPDLADRLARAGHIERSLRIWRRLSARHPAAAGLKARVATLERVMAGLADLEDPAPVSAERRPLPGRAEAFAAACEAAEPIGRRGPRWLRRYAAHFSGVS